MYGIALRHQNEEHERLRKECDEYYQNNTAEDDVDDDNDN